MNDFSTPLMVIGIAAVMACVIIALSIALVRTRSALREALKRQSALKKAKDRFKMLADNSDDGVLVIRDLVFLYANKAVYEMMGISKTASVSINLVDYIHPEDLDIVLEHYEKSILFPDREINFEVRLLRPDKTILWIRNRYIPARWEGQPVNLAFIRDITAKKMMERDLQQAQRLEAIGALSGGIAHEFNNILTTIIGNAEVGLMDLKETDPGSKEFQRIRQAGYRASNLVRQILTITREHSLDVQPLYLTPVVKEALKLLRSTLAKNITIVESIEKQLPMVKADSIQIYQVFMNLCTNAKHAMETVESPCLEVSVAHRFVSMDDPVLQKGVGPGDYVTISVRDNGVGIPQKIRDKVFDPYFTTKNQQVGTGLGLTTTMGIVKQFGGFLLFESQEKKGSCFVVYLPVHERKEPEQKPASPENSAGRTGHLLFVDDEKEITMIARKMLENMGFSVTTATGAQEALSLFAASPESFDVLITDLAMPEKTGDWLVREVTAICPGFPVILCTGHSDTFDEVAARSSGVSEYVKKPYNLKELSAIAAQYISKETPS